MELFPDMAGFRVFALGYGLDSKTRSNTAALGSALLTHKPIEQAITASLSFRKQHTGHPGNVMNPKTPNPPGRYYATIYLNIIRIRYDYVIQYTLLYYTIWSRFQ